MFSSTSTKNLLEEDADTLALSDDLSCCVENADDRAAALPWVGVSVLFLDIDLELRTLHEGLTTSVTSAALFAVLNSELVPRD